MRKKLFSVLTFSLALAICTQSCDKKSETISVRTPAEFEKQASVWVIWPTMDHVTELSNQAVTMEIIQALEKNIPVNIAVANQTVQQQATEALQKKGLVNPNVEFHILPSVQMWIRDMGPNFVLDKNGKKQIVDYNFNSWGYSKTNDPDNVVEEKFDELVAQKLKTPIVSSNLITEGGNRETNGKGSLLLVEAVEMGRNPTWTKAQIEAEFQKTLGVTNIIWLQQGVKEDDHSFLGPLTLKNGEKAYTVVTTNGHIDEFARFVNANTILLAEVDASELADPIAKENKRRMDINFEILKNAKDQNGKPFKIIRMPMPKTITMQMEPGDPVYDYLSTLTYKDGSKFPTGKPIQTIAATSYLNFLISNQVVLVQKYYKPGMDKSLLASDLKAQKILQSVFPNKKIIAIDALSINLGGGGIHCITMQEPL